MTLEALYTAIDGNYSEAKARLMNERLMDKFILKFLDDPTMQTLTSAVQAGQIEESFRAAHTLKGVAANLALTGLAKKASDLTEQLRPCTEAANPALYEAVKQAYEQNVAMIRQYQAEK